MKMKPNRSVSSVQRAEVALLVVALIMMFEMDACAYIDPGTGSVVLQLLAGVLFACLLTIKQWSKFVVSLFTKKQPAADDDQ
jgi:hypothetical protein